MVDQPPHAACPASGIKRQLSSASMNDQKKKETHAENCCREDFGPWADCARREYGVLEEREPPLGDIFVVAMTDLADLNIALGGRREVWDHGTRSRAYNKERKKKLGALLLTSTNFLSRRLFNRKFPDQKESPPNGHSRSSVSKFRRYSRIEEKPRRPR
jgi:hypothetical protein